MCKPLYFVAILVAAFVAVSRPAVAQDVQVTPTKYAFTVSKLELCQSSACSNSTVLGDKTQEFDIGSAVASAGQSVGSYVDQILLTVGTTYTDVKVTMTRTFTLSGGSAAGVGSDGNAGACYTDGTGSGTAAAATSFASTTDSDASGRGSAASDMTMFVPDATGTYAGNLTATFTANGIALIDGTTMSVTMPLTSPFTVSDSAPTFSITFDVANTLNLLGTGSDACGIWHTPPTTTLTLN